jgi:phospholipase C
MPFHQDFVYAISGNVVDFRKSTGANSMSLAPGHGTEVQFTATWGELMVTVDALDINKPTRHVVIGGHVDPDEPGSGVGSSRDEYNQIPVSVELFAPNQTAPVARWQTTGGWSETDMFVFRHTVGTANSPVGKWKCRVTNKGTKAARSSVGVIHNFDREVLRTATVPRFLIDHAYQIVLEALMPRARIEGRKLIYSFGAELLEYFGDSARAVLGQHAKDLPGGLQGTGALQTFQLMATSGREFLDQMMAEWQSRKFDYEKKLAQAQGMGPNGQVAAQEYRKKLRENDAWRSDLETRIHADSAAIHANVAISNVHLEREFDLILGTVTVDFADIEHATADVYLGFDPTLKDAAAFVRTPAEITGGVLNVIQALGFLPELNVILNDHIKDVVNLARPYIGRYLGEALGRLAAREAVFMRLGADEHNWRVGHTSVPSDFQPISVPTPGDVVVGGVIGPTPQGTLGQMPPEFLIVAPTGSPSRPATFTETLKKIDHIVVVMMENRSFDHMLGYLGKPADSAYEGVRGRHANSLSGRAQPVLLREASQVIPQPTTRIPFSPNHGISHVKNQIADGDMSGFAQDYENEHIGFGEYVMTYYTEKEVAVYDRLAREHAVCDHWFAAFPGGTWPNRWSTLAGRTPDIQNLEADDTRIGFLEGTTIFDVLSKYGISWRLFESDLSLIRTFNHYRLDVEHVLPFYNWFDHQMSFEEICKRGQLPSVTFVEPNFRDIPPLSTANDDLAPADILRGQQFISRVVNAVRSAPTWGRTLLLITYDEHGGFYDHVPPPGTLKGPDEWRGRVPPLTPIADPPSNFMGVRVPAILVSPFVRAGGVIKQVFDHTSIIKTILLRWSDRFPTSVFTQFGPRVNIAADLGLALTEPALPIQKPTAIQRPALSANRRARPEPADDPLSRPSGGSDFHEALVRGFLPKRNRETQVKR